MSERRETAGIPDDLILLYVSKTAGGVISEATDMLRGRNPEEQRELILRKEFSNIVAQAIEGSDQRREKRFNQLLQGVAPENLELARLRFGQV